MVSTPPANESKTPFGRSLSKTSADSAFPIWNSTGVIAASSHTVSLELPEINVIVDEIDEEGAICRTKADAPEIDGNLFIEDNFEKIHVGDIVKVNVTASGDYDLWGAISDDQKT